MKLSPALQTRLQVAWAESAPEEDMAARTGLPLEMIRAYYCKLDAMYLAQHGHYPSQLMETMH